MPLSQAYTNACPIYSRARSLGGRTGEAFTVEPKTADRTIEIICVICAIGIALATYGGAL